MARKMLTMKMAFLANQTDRTGDSQLLETEGRRAVRVGVQVLLVEVPLLLLLGLLPAVDVNADPSGFKVSVTSAVGDALPPPATGEVVT